MNVPPSQVHEKCIKICKVKNNLGMKIKKNSIEEKFSLEENIVFSLCK